LRTRRSDKDVLETPTHNDDGSITVEAATAQDALAEVSELLGPDAEILKAGKVQRGGVGGFFSQEMVQLVARRRDGAPAMQPEPASVPEVPADEELPTGRTLADSAMKASFSDMLQRYVDTADQLTGRASAGAEEPLADNAEKAAKARVIKEAFAERREAARIPGMSMLAAELDDDPIVPPVESISRTIKTSPASPDVPAAAVSAAVVAAAPAETAAPVTPVPAPATPVVEAPAAEVKDPGAGALPGTGRVDWSQDELVHVGIPFSLIQATVGLDPDDDIAWVTALAGALAPYCGPLPETNQVIAGPQAHQLADLLGFADVRHPNSVPREGSVCLTLTGTKKSRQWLTDSMNGRDLHLVVGGTGSDRLLDLEPTVVSWVGEDALISALWLCSTRGAMLGYTKIGGRSLRANPIDVAVAIRNLVGRR
jgi:hypothetical protein